MKIQVASDLHLEFAENRVWNKENPIIPFPSAQQILYYGIINDYR
jgi:hypothetical protein